MCYGKETAGSYLCFGQISLRCNGCSDFPVCSLTSSDLPLSSGWGGCPLPASPSAVSPWKPQCSVEPPASGAPPQSPSSRVLSLPLGDLGCALGLITPSTKMTWPGLPSELQTHGSNCLLISSCQCSGSIFNSCPSPAPPTLPDASLFLVLLS